MFSKYDEIRARRARGDKGFTLIELLVVVVIIGILIAIAIPVYLNYQKSAANKSAESDVRNAVSAIAQAEADCGAFPTLPASGISDTTPLSCVAAGASTTAKIVVSAGNTLTFTAPSGGVYEVHGTPGTRGDTNYTYNSNTGRVVADGSSGSSSSSSSS